MRDWTADIRSRLPLPDLRGLRQNRIVEELAGQLADLYDEARRAGASDEEAARSAWAAVADWDELAARIRAAEAPNAVTEKERRRGEVTTGGAPPCRAATATAGPRRAAGAAQFLASLGSDLRFSLRALARRPASTAVALLTLAIGLGATVGVFSVVNGVLLAPLPYPDPDRLVVMHEQVEKSTFSVSYPNFLDWRSGNRAFESMAAYNRHDGLSLTGIGDPVRVDAVRMSASAFDVLGVAPALGRRFVAGDDKLGAARVVIASHPFWRERLRGDPAAVGRPVSLDGVPYLVIGVMPAGFVFPLSPVQPAVYVAIEPFAEKWITQRTNHPGITVLARLREGVPIERGHDDMDRVARAIEAAHPDTNAGSRVRIESLHARTTRRAGTPLLLLLLAVAFLLLIACANTANLMLARAAARRREVAVRAALGAGSGRIVRLVVTESLIVWLAGGLLGVLLAATATAALGDRVAGLLPRQATSPLDLRVVGVGLALSLVTGALFGLAPALRAAGSGLRDAIGSSARHGSGVGRRLRDALIVAEVALALVLLVGSGLTIQSLRNALAVDLGFDPERIVTLKIDLPASRYEDGARRLAFYDALRERVAGEPGIESVATTYVLPMGGGGWQNGYHAEGQPPARPESRPYAEVSAVSPGYFRTMGIRLVRGRDFDTRDRPGSPPVAVVDERFAARYWPGEEPLGKRVKWGGHDSKAPWMEVVGVVAPVRLAAADVESGLQIYVPHAHDNDLAYALVVRTAPGAPAVDRVVRRALLALDPGQPVSRPTPMSELVTATTGRRSVPAAVVTFFAAAASVLAAVGIFGVLSAVIGERRREIGVRMALGARTWQVRALIVGQGMTRVAAGAVLGLTGAAAAGSLLRTWLYGISPFEPVVYASALALLSATALVAAALPAERAARVDVVRVLQAE